MLLLPLKENNHFRIPLRLKAARGNFHHQSASFDP
jgi:hypothetical protein